MRQVGGDHDSWYHDHEMIFRMQALLMEDFTDDYQKSFPAGDNRITYSGMTAGQLRTYFTWRTKYRQGIVEPTALYYVYCLASELINNVGVANPEDGIAQLVALWSECRKFNKRMDTHFRSWIRDYYIVNRESLPLPFPAYIAPFNVPYYDDDPNLLAEAKACRLDRLPIIEVSSSHKITNGRFYKEGNQALIEECVCFVIHNLARFFNSNGVDIKNLFVEKWNEKRYSLFQEATYANMDKPQPGVTVLDPLETVTYANGNWYSECYSVTRYKHAVGYMMKRIEITLRAKFGAKTA